MKFVERGEETAVGSAQWFLGGTQSTTNVVTDYRSMRRVAAYSDELPLESDELLLDATSVCLRQRMAA